MRTPLAVAFLLLAGCAGTSRPVRTAPVPLGPPPAPVVIEPAARAAADRSAPGPAVADAPVVASATVTWRTVTVLPEPAPVAVSEPLPALDEATAHDRIQEPQWRHHGGYRRRVHVPVGTLVGAGIGSAIGRHHGHRSRGAWIGAGIGLLFDRQRPWR